jgi:hypothetical protein
MLDSTGRRLIEMTQVLTQCRASGPVCALEALNIAGLFLTQGDDIINIGSMFPGQQGPPGPPGPPGPGCPENLEERLAAIEFAILEIQARLNASQ